MIKGFTAQELEELAAFDAEVDAEDELTPEEFNFAREMDKTAMRNRLDNQTAHRKSVSAAYKRAYYEKNREEIAAKKRDYYERNKDAIAEYQRDYYERNKDAIAEYQRGYYERNKDAIAEYKRNRVVKNRNNNDVIRLGQRLLHIRKMCGLSQANLARITGLSQSSISNYETGATPMPDALIIWITQKERELYGRDP